MNTHIRKSTKFRGADVPMFR